MIVRTAVLKGKDPLQILAEMEKIDQMGNVKFSIHNTLMGIDT